MVAQEKREQCCVTLVELARGPFQSYLDTNPAELRSAARTGRPGLGVHGEPSLIVLGVSAEQLQGVGQQINYGFE